MYFKVFACYVSGCQQILTYDTGNKKFQVTVKFDRKLKLHHNTSKYLQEVLLEKTAMELINVQI